MGTFSAELAPARSVLQLDAHGAALAAQPAVEQRVGSALEIRRSRLIGCKLLVGAPSMDEDAAAFQLKRVGALASADGLCDLLQFGPPTVEWGNQPRPDLFCGLEETGEVFKVSLWLGPVSLWVLGLHQRGKTAFGTAVAQVTSAGEVHAAPIKGNAFIMEKAAEYVKEKQLKLWLIDILRTSVQVGNALCPADVEGALPATMLLVCSWNGHSLACRRHGCDGRLSGSEVLKSRIPLRPMSRTG